MKLYFATRNQGKASEIRVLLRDTGWQVATTLDGESDWEVQEDGTTFEENARKKARAAAEKTKTWTLADDSGLEVDALQGEPGVHSARYCGPNATDADRSKKILGRMIAVPDDKRTARFRCAICLIDPAGNERVFEGTCEGRIAHHPRGTAGFGYDPIFVPDGYARTLGELGIDIKNGFSHRARAMQQVVGHLKTRVKPKVPSARR